MRRRIAQHRNAVSCDEARRVLEAYGWTLTRISGSDHRYSLSDLHVTIPLQRLRILPVDVAIARRWGRLAAAHGHAGADLLIAATALEHGLAVATSNIRHFTHTGVALVDPLADPEQRVK